MAVLEIRQRTGWLFVAVIVVFAIIALAILILERRIRAVEVVA